MGGWPGVGTTTGVLVDAVAPTVSSVSVPAKDTYVAGDTLSFTVNTSENVTVTGTPRLALTIGSTTVYANYASGSGSESNPASVFKSKDGGTTWRRLEGGLPSGKVGRIGLDIYQKNPDILYAIIENQNPKPGAADREVSEIPTGQARVVELARADAASAAFRARELTERLPDLEPLSRLAVAETLTNLAYILRLRRSDAKRVDLTRSFPFQSGSNSLSP